MIELLYFMALIILMPLRSRQHWVPFQELNMCLLADMCNHTWIPECGYYEKKKHTRLFIDECDMFEYSCDFDAFYKVTNYSECFGPATCPSVPNLLTRVQGFYIYYADGRRKFYNPRKSNTNEMTTTEAPTESTRSTNWNDRRRYKPKRKAKFSWTEDMTTTPCAPCAKKKKTEPVVSRETLSQYWPPLPPLTKDFNALAKLLAKRTTSGTTRKTTRRTTKLTTKRPKVTTQIIRTATIGTVILKKVTVWKNGKKLFKVIKGFKPPPVVTKRDDSDFLE